MHHFTVTHALTKGSHPPTQLLIFQNQKQEDLSGSSYITQQYLSQRSYSLRVSIVYYYQEQRISIDCSTLAWLVAPQYPKQSSSICISAFVGSSAVLLVVAQQYRTQCSSDSTQQRRSMCRDASVSLAAQQYRLQHNSIGHSTVILVVAKQYLQQNSSISSCPVLSVLAKFCQQSQSCVGSNQCVSV